MCVWACQQAFEDLLIADYTLFKRCFRFLDWVGSSPFAPPIPHCLNQITPAPLITKPHQAGTVSPLCEQSLSRAHLVLLMGPGFTRAAAHHRTCTPASCCRAAALPWGTALGFGRSTPCCFGLLVAWCLGRFLSAMKTEGQVRVGHHQSDQYICL